MKRAAAMVAVALAVALGAASGRQGTDPSPNPLKPCPAGQVRKIANIKPPFGYECFPVVARVTTTKHRKKRR